MTYNAAAHLVNVVPSKGSDADRSHRSAQLVTAGGEPVIVAHFAVTKPWRLSPDDPLYPFADSCTAPG